MCEEISLDKCYNVDILFTPKYHCEIAGEGIEYSWGASKRWYRRKPLRVKRTTKEFRELVSNCVKKVDVTMARKFSRKARSYMLVYQHLRKMKELNGDNIDVTHVDIEKLQKVYRGHRDANCIDGQFIMEVMKECNRINLPRETM